MADGSATLSGEPFPSQEPFPLRAKLQREQGDTCRELKSHRSISKLEHKTEGQNTHSDMTAEENHH